MRVRALCRKKTASDKTKRREAAIAEALVTMSPVINGRNEEVEEEKGKSFMDSPSMRPSGKDVDMRKMAILKNAQAHGVLDQLAGKTAKSPQVGARKLEETKEGTKSNPASPGQTQKKEELKQMAIGEVQKKSGFSKPEGDVVAVKAVLKNFET